VTGPNAGALLEKDECVLIVIDLQPGFYVNRPDVNEDVFSGVVTEASRLVGLAELLGVPVVVTEEEPDVNGPTAPEVMERLPSQCPVFPKPIFDLSADDEIRRAVERTRRTHAVLAGLETDVCVLHSAVGLMERGYAVSAVVDALYSPEPDHRIGLGRLRFHGVELVNAKSVFYDWARTPDEARELRRRRPEVAPTATHLPA
jgi:nicotinamidase-related amidase